MGVTELEICTRATVLAEDARRGQDVAGEVALGDLVEALGLGAGEVGRFRHGDVPLRRTCS